MSRAIFIEFFTGIRYNDEPQQTEQTRRKIVEAVHECMREADLSDITIRSVCQRAGVSIGTFYLYFSCKEAALLYGYRQADAQFEALKLTSEPWENIQRIMDLLSAYGNTG